MNQLTTIAALPAGGGCKSALPPDVHSAPAMLPLHDPQWLRNCRQRPVPKYVFEVRGIARPAGDVTRVWKDGDLIWEAPPAPAVGSTEAFADMAASACVGESTATLDPYAVDPEQIRALVDAHFPPPPERT